MERPISGLGFRDGLVATRGTMICALVVVLVDGVLDGSYLFAMLFCHIWFLVAVVRAWAQPPRIEVAAARVSIPLITLLLLIANASLQNRIAMTRAVRIIRGCEDYHDARGSFPERLDDLVPDYLGSVPRAKYCLFYGEFWYIPAPQPLLVWYEFPPFGRRVHNFERGSFGFVD